MLSSKEDGITTLTTRILTNDNASMSICRRRRCGGATAIGLLMLAGNTSAFYSGSAYLRSSTRPARLSSFKLRDIRLEEPVPKVNETWWARNGPKANVAIPSKALSNGEDQMDQNEIPSAMLSAPPFMANMTAFEMTAMSTVGLAFAMGVIYSLATSGDPVSVPPIQNLNDVGNGLEILENKLGGLANNVIDAALPTTATDFVSVALGEGIAGVIGAGATVLISFLLKFRLGASNSQQRAGAIFAESSDGILSEAVADGDYFFTRAAALPLLEAVGIPSFVATLTSVVLASVPYEIIKAGARRRKARLAEDTEMDRLLRDEQEKNQIEQGKSAFSISSSKQPSVDPLSLIPVGDAVAFDFPEVFADVTKWLEYDVLKADFGGQLVLNGQILSPSADSACFGFLAALSSQLYADTIYRYTEYGTTEKREESRNRSLVGWASLYTNKCLNSAALFGVYEFVKTPVSTFIAGLLAGGIDNCFGSEDYNMCMETYMRDNPAGASPEAQLRSLLTALVSLWDRFQSGDPADTIAFGRSLFVQLYSFATQLLSLNIYASP